MPLACFLADVGRSTYSVTRIEEVASFVATKFLVQAAAEEAKVKFVGHETAGECSGLGRKLTRRGV